MRDIIFGLDFGTSCTKVVLQDPLLPKAWAIPFEQLPPENHPYFLPTQIEGDDAKIFHLTSKNAQFKDLKRHLLIPETYADILACAFLAKVIEYARSYFLKTNKNLYQREQIQWILNLGIPSIDDPEIKQTFHNTAKAAWWLSNQK